MTNILIPVNKNVTPILIIIAKFIKDNNLNLYGIDINSKFEEYPGYKDLKIIKKLFKKLEK